jgi:endonuclease YncB( thermonuclease family)
MLAHLPLALLALLLFTWNPAPAHQSAVLSVTADDALIEAMVTRAVDGSSVDAHVLGARTALGYLGADVMAANHPCGREALERNRELAGSQLLLLDDPIYQFDERGRRLYYAFTPDGRSIEAILIREGLAWAARTDASRGPELAALQAEAEAAGQGCLWSGV